MSEKSKIFVPTRSLGLVSTEIPLKVRYIKRRKQNFVCTSVGKSFHTYESTTLKLLSVSNPQSSSITALAADEYHVYTACEEQICAWRRGTELKHTYKGHENTVHLLLPFGPHLLSVDDKSSLKIWDIKSEELYTELQFENKHFQITTLIHPATYINKILLGSQQGLLQLWNINKGQQVFCFPGWGSGITSLEQSPAVDVVAVGLANGVIVVHNLRFDETLMQFKQDWGAVTSLSFRTDQKHLLVSGSTEGHLAFWNLESKKLENQLDHAHEGPVTGLCCLFGEQTMLTSSPDNSLKLWIFDMSDGGARLLNKREGHSAPATKVRFHGSKGENVLSAGGDSTLRILNTLNETFNKSLGRASLNRKASKKKKSYEDNLTLPPIVEFTSETTREKEWDNITCIHRNTGIVTTWSYDKLKMGQLKLRHERFRSAELHKAVPTCLSLTHCGNFVVIGYSSGHVDRFNIQSGIHRATYGTPLAHQGGVNGVATDKLNQLIVTGGRKPFLKMWHFKNCNEIGRIDIPSSVLFLACHRESSLMAAALEDFGVAVVDLDSQSLIRKLYGHKACITDMTFSPDSRWLITTSMDCSIRTWDLPSSQLVDMLVVDQACTSLSFSPTSQYLATTHVENLGVSLWSNRTLYSLVTLEPLDVETGLPVTDLSSIQDIEQDEGIVDVDGINLVSLSLEPQSRWANVINIDVIKQRNKPKEPPKKPATAPFFLPSTLGLSSNMPELPQEGESRLIKTTSLVSLTAFGRGLQNAATNDEYVQCLKKLREMPSSAASVEIDSLGPDAGGSVEMLIQFIKMLDRGLGFHKDFNSLISCVAQFVKAHHTVIRKEPEIIDVLRVFASDMQNSWKAIESKYSRAVTAIYVAKNVVN